MDTKSNDEYAQTCVPFIGMCNETSIVQKSYPLLSLWKSPLTLLELKILDAYLARIDSRKPEQRWVRFSKGEIESMLGVTRIKPVDLKTHLRNLCLVVDIEDSTIPGGFHSISLFEQMVCIPDTDGRWQVDMQCTDAAMRYIFCLDNIGYLKYRLWAILNLRSRYSYILFLYIESNSFRKIWSVPLDELRGILRCDIDSYREFRRFNEHILKKAQTEIHEKTDCRFTYTTIKHGRKVHAIKFQCNQPAIPSKLDAQCSEISNINELDADITKREKLLELLQSACSRNGTPEFSTVEMTLILETMRMVPTNVFPKHGPGGLAIAMYHYLCERYSMLNYQDEKHKVRHRLAYLLSIIKNDIG